MKPPSPSPPSCSKNSASEPNPPAPPPATARLTGWRAYSLPWSLPGHREGWLLRWQILTRQPAEPSQTNGPTSPLQTSTPTRLDVWSEAAPLTGWSRESHTQTAQWLENAAAAHGRLEVLPPPPSSIAWARDAAILHATGWPGLSPPHSPLPIACLLTSPEYWHEQTESALTQGARVFKIKVTPASLPRLPAFLQWLERICSSTTQPLKVRLDANRTLSAGESATWAPRLASPLLEFWEEPAQNPEELSSLLTPQFPIPIALDETLREISPAGLTRFQGAHALVLKPTLMGPWSLIHSFITRGAALNITPVISAAYESSLGLSLLADLAARLPAHAHAAGLDTWRALQHDVCPNREPLQSFLWHLPLPFTDPAHWQPRHSPIWKQERLWSATAP